MNNDIEGRGRVKRETVDAVPEASYRIAVAVEKSGSVEQLLRTALDIAHDNEGEVLVVSVVTKPRESPFTVFTDETIKREFSGDRRDILDRALSMADGTDVPVRGRLLVSHDVSQGIEKAVRTFDCDAVLLGWNDQHRAETVFGRNVDRVVTRAPSDVLVEKIGPVADGVDTVLLPATEGPNTEFATTVARAIALSNDAQVDVLHFVASDVTEVERTIGEQLVEDVADLLDPVTDADIRKLVRETDDVPAAIIEATETRDVTVLGATQRGWVQRLVAGPTPEKVARDAKSTVIVAKHGGKLSSRISYWVRRFG
jgi:nucleotide-binding universal stress UspA family protein